MVENKKSRRKFLKNLGLTGTALASVPAVLTGKKSDATVPLGKRKKKTSPNDTLQLALIGAGGMGRADLKTALQHPNTEVVAVSDLYDGRLQAARETFGDHIFTTRDYRKIIDRDEVDVVIVATQDHWHKQISIDALKNDKHVYCEKPMVHSIDEGPEIIKAQKKSGKVFVVGSQLLSSLGYEKAKQLLKDGAIGKLNYAEGVWARRSAKGAWNYPIPEDASEETVAWDTYLKNTKYHDFDPERFFRWRKYKDYGTGMNGDLFVHIISGVHFITDSLGPNQIYSTGGIRFWNDGREVPDVLIGTFDYPEVDSHPGFNLSLRCNFVDGTKGSGYYVMRLVGSEGFMEIRPNQVVYGRNKILDGTDPYMDPAKIHEQPEKRKKILGPETIVYEAEKGYKGCHYDHFDYFFDAIRKGTDVVEDATFGYRAAAPALACHESYYKKKVIQWDPKKMKIVD
ncbi:MAG TPA: Gfo/Idh/MocA family oxidoreductase [bacterium]|nr:Gfo/Idh/MocA family oxidoreductase [bacterium]